MKSINQVTLIGTSGKDAEFKQTESFKNANFNLATSESYVDKNGNKVENTIWHRITGFGYNADYIQKWIKKGSRVAVFGKINNREYTDKDGVKKNVSEIVADNVLLLSQSTNETQNTVQAPQQPNQVDAALNGEDDTLPF